MTNFKDLPMSVSSRMSEVLASFKNNPFIQKATFLKENKLYPYFRAIEEAGATQVNVGNSKQIMIGSNNYLGLTHHPYVKEKSIKAIEKYGTGCTGSRFLNGNFTIHEELEEKLAKFIGHEAALVYATGMQVNLGSLSALVGPNDCAFSDMENHASIIDGLRLAQGKVIKYKHNDMEDLEELIIANKDQFKRMYIVTDGVFSMTGAVVNLPKLVEIAKKHDCLIYVDDAHGLGMMGPHGRGTAAHFGLTNDVHCNMGTFSKSFASVGGYVSGSKEMINYIKHLSRSFIFSAALPPSAVAAVIACIELCEKDNSLQEKVFANAKFMSKGLNDLGFNTLKSPTPIIPVLIGDDVMAMQITQFLQQQGIFATPVIAPATPPGMALIRTSYSSLHTKEELQTCLDVFEKVKKNFQIPAIH